MSENYEISWRGFSLDDIYDGYEVFADRNEAPSIEKLENHTILFNYPYNDEVITPAIREGIWDDNHVKLPNSPESVYFEIDNDDNKLKKQRWNLIKSSLTQEKIINSHQLEKAIKAYNTKFEKDWKFTSLHKLFEDEFLEEESEYFFDKVLPKIIEIALRLDDLIKSPIPLLQQSMNHSVSMSKEQAACLLANAFLCTFPKRNGPRKSTDFPEINFNRLFCTSGSNVVEKIKCICNYFRRVLVISMPVGIVTFQRRSIEFDELPKWEESELKFSSVKWHIDSYGRIETSPGMLQMDFANRYLGGGVLGFGCVQEEIKFMIKPECIIGMLLCTCMKSTEAILIYGSEQYSKYSGYSGSFKWEGNYVDETPCDKYRRKLSYIVAVDALPFRNPYMQFEEKLIRRDVNKAFCGFYHDPGNHHKGVPVAGGFWGCGAFGGFNKLKCLIQLIACVANRRNLVFYTFGNEELVDEMHNMFSFLCENDITIGQLWSYLAVFKSQNKKFDEFYQFIYNQHTLSQSLEHIYQSASNENFFAEQLAMEKRRTDFLNYEHDSDDDKFLENPSKRSKTDDNESCSRSIDEIQDDKSDIGCEIEISQKFEPGDEDSLEEIIVVTSMANEDQVTNQELNDELENETVTVKSGDCDDMESEKDSELNDSSSHQNLEAIEEVESHPVQKTILDYFKRKVSDF